jgi:hypothetical protein
MDRTCKGSGSCLGAASHSGGLAVLAAPGIVPILEVAVYGQVSSPAGLSKRKLSVLFRGEFLGSI